MRVYRGRRAEGPPERVWIDVFDDVSGRSYPVVEVPATNTTGIEWGYSGTGAHNAARAILADYFGSIPLEHVSRFEREIIATRDRLGFDLPVSVIDEWFDQEEES